MDRRAAYVTAIVGVHLLVNITHGLAHRELRVGLALPASIFVIVVVLIVPLLSMALVWTVKKRLGLILLTLSMSASFLFGLYHHFLALGPDHVDSQPWGPWGLVFGLTAYALLITEAIGTYTGIHFLWVAASDDAVIEKVNCEFVVRAVALCSKGVQASSRGSGIARPTAKW